MIELSAFQRDCLVVIAGSSCPDKQKVKAALEDYYHLEILDARLPPNLDELVSAGYADRTNGTKQVTYDLTEDGFIELARHRAWKNSYMDDVL